MSLRAEYETLLMQMVDHHSIFYKLWSITSPRFSTQIQTACVYFDTNGNEIVMEFNEDFWKSISDTKKRFVICHETLHMLLNHGKRTIHNKRVSQLVNVCQDIVINERLVSMYGFRREEVDPDNEYCWVDTVFPKDYENMSTVDSFEHYFNILYKTMDDDDGNDSSDGREDGGSGSGGGNLPNTVDDHDQMGSFEDINTIAGGLSDDEIVHINEFIENNSPPYTDYGTVGGGKAVSLTIDRVPTKRKWETVIKKWASRYMIFSDRDVEQWVVTDRRWNALNTDLMLPSDYEQEDSKNDFSKIDVWFFQDTSGSCAGFAKRFFDAARSLPTKRFNIRMFCFDTEVYETDIDTGKLYGFGGTSFSAIERHIQKLCGGVDGVAYPSAVFVITDGYGDSVNPQYPRNWHWFLSTNATHCIPSKSNVYNLKDFE